MSGIEMGRGREAAGEEAAQWLCELREGDAAVRAKFAAWLKDSPRNVREFLLVSATVKAFDGVGPSEAGEINRMVTEAVGNGDGNVVRMEGAPSPYPLPLKGEKRKSRKMRWAGAMAAAVAIASIGLWAVPVLTGTQTYTTAIGEQRAIRLSDGSFAHLNTQSRVKVRYSNRGRELELVDGEALFVVAQDRSRPFRVHSGASVIQAIGTQFNVYRRADDIEVSVIEGAVKVLGAQTPVSAGEQVQIESNGEVVKSAAVDVSDAIAWREQRLVFRAQRLADIAAEFNRYNPVRIRVEGEVKERRFTGTGTANSPQSLVQFLSQYDDIGVEKTADGITIRGR